MGRVCLILPLASASALAADLVARCRRGLEGAGHTVEVLARIALVLALWRFCRAFTSGKSAARWALLLALFASGFELFAAVIGGYSGNWSYELNGFGLLFAAPHVPLAMAATLELAREGLLRPRFHFSEGQKGHPPFEIPLRWLLKMGALSAVVALLHPFHEPVLLGAMFIAGLIYWRSGRGVATLAAAMLAGFAALPVLWPTIATFSFQPFWGLTYTSQNLLPSPAPHQLLVDLGPTLVLAIAGAAMFRGRVAPFGMVLWLLLALIAMYLPVPYQRRLSFGIQPTVAVLAANALMAASGRLSQRRASILRLGTVALAASSTVLILVSVVASSFRNAPLPVYRSTTDLDAAATWLATEAGPSDIILADWDASNYLAARRSILPVVVAASFLIGYVLAATVSWVFFLALLAPLALSLLYSVGSKRLVGLIGTTNLKQKLLLKNVSISLGWSLIPILVGFYFGARS